MPEGDSCDGVKRPSSKCKRETKLQNGVNGCNYCIFDVRDRDYGLGLVRLVSSMRLILMQETAAARKPQQT
jgi:hypothetical protein